MNGKVVAAGIMVLAVCCYLTSSYAKNTEGNEFNTSAEQIGGLRLGLSEKDVYSANPCKPKKTKEILEGATGEYIQTWKFPDCGLELKMSTERKGGEKVVSSISITGPSKLVTNRGIHIGSSEGEVMEAYGRYRDQEGFSEKGKNFVAGSVFDGMIFDFKDGRVVQIFLGAAAE